MHGDEVKSMRQTRLACVYVCENVRGALWEQCSVQFRSEQRRPRPGQSQSSGNPRVFRSPGPYLMGLSKKKVALSRAFLSHCLPLALLFPSFSHTPPRLDIPWSHFANEWIPSVYSAALPVPCMMHWTLQKTGRTPAQPSNATWSHQIEGQQNIWPRIFLLFCIAPCISILQMHFHYVFCLKLFVTSMGLQTFEFNEF